MFSGYKTARCIVVALAVATLPLSSAVNAADKAEHSHETSKKGAMSDSSMEMHRSMMKGMKEMQGMKLSGNVDYDFATMMRHHHMMGVQMAQQQLQNGKDQKMRDMAQKIIDSQKKEIVEFDEWLKANPHNSAKAHK